MKKEKRMDLRITEDLKKTTKENAKKKHMNTSEYICDLIEKDTNSMSHEQITPNTLKSTKTLSHEQMVQNALSENELINGLLTNSEIPNKTKQLIGKEMRKYV